MDNHIARMRHERGFTQQRLAQETGLSIGTIQVIEYGRKRPRIDTVQAIARALGCSVADLFPEEAPQGAAS